MARRLVLRTAFRRGLDLAKRIEAQEGRWEHGRAACYPTCLFDLNDNLLIFIVRNCSDRCWRLRKKWHCSAWKPIDSAGCLRQILGSLDAAGEGYP